MFPVKNIVIQTSANRTATLQAILYEFIYRNNVQLLILLWFQQLPISTIRAI